MGVPSFQQLMLPALQTIGQRYDEISISGLEDEVSKALRISGEDRRLRLPSGNQTLFANRLNWARSYLSKAGLIELPRRGYCRATDRGRELLAEGMSEIDLGTLERYPEFVAWRSQSKGGETEEETGSRDDAEESIASSFELLNAELARDIVGRVHSFSPAFFERLIIDLLLRMGYGGGRVEMGRALGRVGNGGVDGVIKEDELGLDVVYVQAKRLDPNKGVPLAEVRDFVGGLEGASGKQGRLGHDLVLSLHRLRFHHPRLEARRADRWTGACQSHDPPSRRRPGQGRLRGAEDRRGLFRRTDVLTVSEPVMRSSRHRFS